VAHDSDQRSRPVIAHMTESKLEFECNENVVIADDAPAKFRPGELGWVISARTVENELQAKTLGYPVGTLLYLVEYMDGSDMKMPGEFIRHRS